MRTAARPAHASLYTGSHPHPCHAHARSQRAQRPTRQASRKRQPSSVTRVELDEGLLVAEVRHTGTISASAPPFKYSLELDGRRLPEMNEGAGLACLRLVRLEARISSFVLGAEPNAPPRPRYRVESSISAIHGGRCQLLSTAEVERSAADFGAMPRSPSRLASTGAPCAAAVEFSDPQAHGLVRSGTTFAPKHLASRPGNYVCVEPNAWLVTSSLSQRRGTSASDESGRTEKDSSVAADLRPAIRRNPDQC